MPFLLVWTVVCRILCPSSVEDPANLIPYSVHRRKCIPFKAGKAHNRNFISIAWNLLMLHEKPWEYHSLVCHYFNAYFWCNLYPCCDGLRIAATLSLSIIMHAHCLKELCGKWCVHPRFELRAAVLWVRLPDVAIRSNFIKAKASMCVSRGGDLSEIGNNLVKTWCHHGWYKKISCDQIKPISVT